jgi:hypothetical protein
VRVLIESAAERLHVTREVQDARPVGVVDVLDLERIVARGKDHGGGDSG